MNAFPNGEEAFRWTADTGMLPLGDLPGGSFQSTAFALSAMPDTRPCEHCIGMPDPDD